MQGIGNFKEDDLPYEELAINNDWIAIVNLAKQIKKQMAEELSIDVENPSTW